MSFFFFKQKTAYEMRISDWSSDVCSSVSALWMLVEPGLSPQPSLDALAHRSARRGPPNVLTIDPKIEDYPARVKRLLFGQAEPGGVSRPALADETLDLLVIHAPETLPDALQQIGRASWRERVCQYV